MANDTVQISVPASVSVDLPKGSGKLDILTRSMPADILAALFEHGLRQKLGDSGVGHHFRGEKTKDGKLRSFKDSDTVSDSEAAMKKAIRETAITLSTRLQAGEWTLPGGGRRGDPLKGEVWSQVFIRLGTPSKARAGLLKVGLDEAFYQIAERSAKKPAPSKKVRDEWIAQVKAKITAAAEKVLAERTMDLDLDLK